MTWRMRSLYAGVSRDLATELASLTLGAPNTTTAVTLVSTTAPTGYSYSMKLPLNTAGADCRLQVGLTVIGNKQWRFRAVLNADGTFTSAPNLLWDETTGFLTVNTSRKLVVTTDAGSLTSTTAISTAANTFSIFDVFVDNVRKLVWLWDNDAASWFGPLAYTNAPTIKRWGELLGAGVSRGANLYALLYVAESTSASDAPDTTQAPDVKWAAQFPNADDKHGGGTANAAVSTTDTTLTDTRLSEPVDKWINHVITCNGKDLIITSNTATTFTGTTWSGGGNPGNGFAWTMAVLRDDWSIGAGAGAKSDNWDDGRGAEADGNDGTTTYLKSPLAATKKQLSQAETRDTVGIASAATIEDYLWHAVVSRGITGKVASIGTLLGLNGSESSASIGAPNASFQGIHMFAIDVDVFTSNRPGGGSWSPSDLDGLRLGAQTGSSNDMQINVTMVTLAWSYYTTLLSLAPAVPTTAPTLMGLSAAII